MEVMIMGYGVVGKACAVMLADKGHLPIPYDPALGLDKVDPAEVEVALICVPAPTDFEDGSVDVTAITDCLARLRMGATAIIRSTIPPGTTDMLNAAHPGKHVFFVPEFLTEATAEHDAKFPSRVLIGIPEDGPPNEAVELVRELMKPTGFIMPSDRMVTMSATSAEFAKYIVGKDARHRTGGDFVKMCHFGLVHRLKRGSYRVTRKGVSWLRGEIEIPERVICIGERAISIEGKPVSVVDVLGRDFRARV